MDPELQQKINRARAAGYSDKEIQPFVEKLNPRQGLLSQVGTAIAKPFATTGRNIGGAAFELARLGGAVEPTAENPLFSNQELAEISRDPRKFLIEQAKASAGILAWAVPGGKTFQPLVGGSQLGGAVLSGGASGALAGVGQTPGTQLTDIAQAAGRGGIAGGITGGALNLFGRGIKTIGRKLKTGGEKASTVKPIVKKITPKIAADRARIRGYEKEFNLTGGPEQKLEQINEKRVGLVKKLKKTIADSQDEVAISQIDDAFRQNLLENTDYVSGSKGWEEKVNIQLRKLIPKDFAKSQLPKPEQVTGNIDDITKQIATVNKSLGKLVKLQQAGKAGQDTAQKFADLTHQKASLSAQKLALQQAAGATGITNITSEQLIEGVQHLKEGQRLSDDAIKFAVEHGKNKIGELENVRSAIRGQLPERAFSSDATVNQGVQVKKALYDTLTDVIYDSSPKIQTINQQLTKLHQLVPGIEKLAKKGVKFPIPIIGGFPLPAELTRNVGNIIARKAARAGQAIETGLPKIPPQVTGAITKTAPILGGTAAGAVSPSTLPDIDQLNVQGMQTGTFQQDPQTGQYVSNDGQWIWSGSEWTPNDNVISRGATAPQAGGLGQGLTQEQIQNLTFAALSSGDPKLIDTVGKLVNLIGRAEPQGGLPLSSAQVEDVAIAKSGLESIDEIHNLIGLRGEKAFGQLALRAIPGQLGARDFDSLMFNIADSVLRLRTGAQAPETEIRRYMRSFLPRLGDNSQTIQNKLRRAQQTLKDVYNLNIMSAQSKSGNPGTLPDIENIITQ